MTMTDFASTYDTSFTYDEMFDEHGHVREAYESILNVFHSLKTDEFDVRGELRDQAFRDQGITFSYSGEERPWPMDLIPRIITAREWTGIEAGIIQRVQALEAFLEDIYSDGNIIDDGIILDTLFQRHVISTDKSTDSRPAMVCASMLQVSTLCVTKVASSSFLKTTCVVLPEFRMFSKTVAQPATCFQKSFPATIFARSTNILRNFSML